MAISNTSILIKRSSSSATPTSLKAGELAVSYSSNNIFIGSPTGDGALPIGGYNTYTTVNNATNANTAATLVKRDASGAFFGQLFGNANSATVLQTSRNFSISGGDITATAQGFDGSGSVVLSASLNSVPGLTAGQYGSTTAIPQITVAANGRIIAIGTQTIATSFTVSGNTGSGSQAGGGTLNISGASNSGIFTVVTGTGGDETVTLFHDNTIVRSNTQAVGPQVIQTDLTLTGNLTVQGTRTFVNTTSLNIADPVLYLAANNYSSDTVEIGFAANYYDGTSQRHTGLIREAASKQYFMFDNYQPELSSNNILDRANTSFRLATLNANLTSGMVSGLANTIGIQDGGTNNKTYTQNQIVFYNGSGIVSLANVTAYTTQGGASYVPVVTTDAFGRVTSISNTQIQLDTSNIISGTLGVARGGTGATTFTMGQLIVGNSTGALQSLSNTTFTATGSGAANNTITSVTVDAYGRFTAATYSAISGLTVAQGGTGRSTFTSNGITYGNGTGALQVTAAADTADQTWSNQILTVTNAGVPVWTSQMDGGTF